MIRLDDVGPVYGRSGARTDVRALDHVTLRFAPGTFTAVMGPSGSGKSTLLHCASRMDPPTGGSVWWDDVDVAQLPERRPGSGRRRQAAPCLIVHAEALRGHVSCAVYG